MGGRSSGFQEVFGGTGFLSGARIFAQPGKAVPPVRKIYGSGQDLSYQRAIKRLFFVILSVAKNLSFKSAEILHSAALRSE
jgi:hypothetical protein